ncbi:rRNA maturation RNase YbeY, partial [Porphyromonas loveana]
MARINYYAEGVTQPRLRKRILAQWIADVAERYGKQVGEISYLFCDDEYILKTNREFLDHDYYTDIITFDTTEGDTIGGDLLISLDTVRSNALSIGTRYAEELHRVIIHGILHLCGLK